MEPTFPEEKQKRWRRKHTISAVLLAGAVLTLWQPSKYVLLEPGPSRPVTGRVEAVSKDVKTYNSSGQFNLVTVFVSRATWWEYAISKTPWSDAKAVELPMGRQSKTSSKADMVSSEQTASMVAENYVFGEVKSMRPDGALVVEVVSGMPAESSGVLEGDLVLKVDGKTVLTAKDAASAVASGTNRIVLTVKRDGKEREIRVSVEDGKIGVRISDHYDGKPILTVDNGEVGGGSAGLAMTLSFIDYLTPGDLTGGDILAATGVINIDGSVEHIDGVNFKALGAIKAGAKVMFVPRGQAEEITATGIKIVEVSNVQEAIDFLCKRGSNDEVCAR
jgi:PDZ domain-containing protein